MASLKKDRRRCGWCGDRLGRHQKRYCSQVCNRSDYRARGSYHAPNLNRAGRQCGIRRGSGRSRIFCDLAPHHSQEGRLHHGMAADGREYVWTVDRNEVT